MILTRPRVHARSNGAASVVSPAPLDRDTIARFAPSVLAESKHVARSERYTYVPTIQIVEHLQANGYGVFSVMQSGSRDDDRRGFTKHLIRFRPVGQTLTVGGTHPEMVLINSHDGSSAYRLTAGIFRLVCSNGLIVAASTMDDFRIRHTGDILGEISGAVERMRVALPAVTDRVEQFQRLQLTAGEREIFGRAALAARYGSTEEAPVTAADIVRTRRREDDAPTLWNVLNATQENIIRGGIPYVGTNERGRRFRRRTGAVSSVDGNAGINRALWQLADEMAKLKS